MYEIFLPYMEQEGKFTRLTVLIAKTNSLQANLTQFGCEIGIQLEGANARKWKDLCKLGTQSQQCSKLKLGETMTDEELQEMIDRADSNGDGAVSMDDFYNIMTKKTFAWVVLK